MAAPFLLGARTRGFLLSLLVACLLLGAASAPAGQSPTSAEPSFAELDALWTRFWEHVRQGDLQGARREVHLRLRGAFQDGFPETITGDGLREMAQQMAYCRLEPTREPSELGTAAYRATCRHGRETAERLVIFRQDVDGQWRLFVF